MKNMDWRNLAELIGIGSIVPGLILVAWEIHHPNNIAKAQMVMDPATKSNEFNSSTFENPVVADLLAAMSGPDQLNVSDTQNR